MPKRVLILCTGNSCRSQMAEAFWNDLSAGAWAASSAGAKPSGYVHPLAVEVMAELELDISTHQSQHVDEFASESFDLAVTVCDNAQAACGVFPNATSTVHWPFDDPADATGSDDEKRGCFRRVRDQIRARIGEFLKTSAASE